MAEQFQFDNNLRGEFTECEFIGLNRYTYTFATRKQLRTFCELNSDRCEMQEILVNNGHAVEVVFPRIVIEFE